MSLATIYGILLLCCCHPFSFPTPHSISPPPPVTVSLLSGHRALSPIFLLPFCPLFLPFLSLLCPSPSPSFSLPSSPSSSSSPFSSLAKTCKRMYKILYCGVLSSFQIISMSTGIPSKTALLGSGLLSAISGEYNKLGNYFMGVSHV